MVQVLTGLSKRPFQLTFDPRRLRPADDPRIVGDNQKVRGLGYQPRYSLQDTVRYTLQYWREKRP
jgi:GDP-D-mannose dehydratase